MAPKRETKKYNKVYEIEKILKYKFKSGKRCQVLIKWKNYSRKYAIWEPMKNIRHISKYYLI